MSQAVLLQLDVPINDVGVVGAEPEEQDPHVVAETLVAQMKTEFEQQTQALQQQLASQQTALNQASRALRSAGEELASLQRQMIEEMRNEALRVAMEIAQKVLCQEIQSKGYQIEPIVKQALARIPQRGKITVRLCPDDYERCGLTNRDADTQENISFVADPNVLPAGCYVESAEGHVEATPSGALREIEKTLREGE